MTAIEIFEAERNKPAVSSASVGDAILDAAEKTLTVQSDFHRLFDAKLIRVRHRLGLPITQPTSLRNIPEEHDVAFRDAYTAAAREVGQRFLDAGQLADAWAYFRTINETASVRAAIAKKVAEVPHEPGAGLDELLNLALYEGAHIVEGLKLLLRTHGTCNTVTAMGQVMPQMTPDERRQAAAMMVRNIYGDLQANVRRDVERRQPLVKQNASLRELIQGREFLFAEGGYHIDVSHLHSTVSFARHLDRDCPELQLAIELSDYGAQLAEPLRYPSDVPFDDYYVANRHFLNALAGVEVDESMQYFIDRLQREPDAPDQRMIAFVIADLGQRVERTSMALEAAAPFLKQMEDPAGFSFTAYCVGAKRFDILESSARENNDVLGLATVLLLQKPVTK
ncbi:MAG: hypothetical protein DWI22_11720 [Planctomycetota bacterium]|jgi:hypothetical protein|nr:hypothetical protein [Planctomycetales bacterium]RLT06552.1 MAG: hypothetical protein DWI22_11720 [Planctomycetota bacterium]